MDAVSDVMPKGQFATLCGVSAGRVSQWISEGKIGGDALVGEGRTARIRVSVAQEQLQRRLDVGQRLGNGIGTRLDAAPVQALLPTLDSGAGQGAPPSAPRPAAGPSSHPSVPAAGASIVDGGEVDAAALRSLAATLEDQLKVEKLWKAQSENRRLRKEELAAQGLLMETDAAVAAQKRVAGQILTTVEGGLATMAQAMAERFELPQRDVLHLLRQEFRAVRASVADVLRREALEMPETVSFELGEEDASESRGVPAPA